MLGKKISLSSMRVLWFSVTPSMYNPRSNSYNGGGWIASLERIVRGIGSIRLGVAFYFDEQPFRQEKDGVSYYPMPTLQGHGVGRWMYRKALLKRRLDHWLRVVDDFKPDLIQIFGSENEFGLLIPHVKVPVVIHMQGCLPPYHNALFPVGMHRSDFLLHSGLPWRKRLMGLLCERSFRKQAQREVGIIRSCRCFMGRTEWDKGLIRLFNPGARYYHCEEALRSAFLSVSRRWSYPSGDKLRLMSVISSPWYKGQDLILKTARLLTQFGGREFEWNVYGVEDMRFFESKYGIRAADVGVRVCGFAGQEQLADALCGSMCYVHPGYIDNSPNSLCEAQLLGVPVIAVYVGGIPSLIKHGETGILVPANAPYSLAAQILDLVSDKGLCLQLSERERAAAQVRHDPVRIAGRIESIYQHIIGNQ